MQKAQLTLTIEDINKILGALVQQPYVQVAELINDIQTQATAQLKDKAASQSTPMHKAAV
jgi:hypothetical protein